MCGWPVTQLVAQHRVSWPCPAFFADARCALLSCFPWHNLASPCQCAAERLDYSSDFYDQAERCDPGSARRKWVQTMHASMLAVCTLLSLFISSRFDLA